MECILAVATVFLMVLCAALGYTWGRSDGRSEAARGGGSDE